MHFPQFLNKAKLIKTDRPVEQENLDANRHKEQNSAQTTKMMNTTIGLIKQFGTGTDQTKVLQVTGHSSFCRVIKSHKNEKNLLKLNL